MTSLTISLPEALKEFIEAQALKGGFESPEAYIRFLVRDAQLEVDPEGVEEKLLEAVRGEAATPLTREDWDGIREEGRRRLETQGPR